MIRLRVLPQILPIDGKQIELQVTATHIQWRYTDAPDWVDLIALSELVGPEGPAIEMRSNGTNIQYRQIGSGEGGWVNVIPLVDITGPPSLVPGPQGPSVADGNKGDVTVSGGGLSWTINAGAVALEELSTALATAIPVLSKVSAASPAIARTGAGTASVKAGTTVKVGTTLVRFASDAAITMPTLTAGTDYAVFVSSAGAAQAVAWTSNTGVDPTPPGGTWTWIGGFHYAPGSNGSSAEAGGNTTPQINAQAIWDLKFRPDCPDPRGMTFTGSCWIDIYFLNTGHETIGSSRENQPIANGSVRPIRPLRFGGNGSSLQNFTWWAAAEALQIHGKRFPTYAEMCTAAYGVKEQTSRGTVPVKTGLGRDNAGTVADQNFTSWCGVIQATGCHWVWLDDFNYWPDSTGGQAQRAITEGRGSILIPGDRAFTVLLFGGKYNLTVESGSRTTETIEMPSDTSQSISARGAADHMVLL